ncbi:hypothetical protein ACSV5K_24140 [Agrobacterium pusense]|uniref:hypothetical protein n=1 Tax=Agrobacterium pusense TaxID=648995 RepID=UPI003FD4F9B1
MTDFKQFATSSNGDSWSVGKRQDGVAVVRHKANSASGEHETILRVDEFLLLRHDSPEQAALLELLDAEIDNEGQSSLDSSSL